MYAGKHVDIAADGDVNLVSGGLTHVTAGQGLILHACGGGADLRAASGPLRIEASEHDVRVDARQALTLSSRDDEILLTGRTIRLVAGDGSFIKLGDGIEIGSPGTCRIDVDRVKHAGPRSMERPLTSSKPITTRQRAQLVFHDADPTRMVPIAGRPYSGSKSGDTPFEGTTDHEGMTEQVEADAVTRAQVSFGHAARATEGGVE
jgi:type VI secretion system secreted protein VgrG